MGLVAPWHVGSSQTRARTRVLCIGRRILSHWATKEVPMFFLTHHPPFALVSEVPWFYAYPFSIFGFWFR